MKKECTRTQTATPQNLYMFLCSYIRYSASQTNENFWGVILLPLTTLFCVQPSDWRFVPLLKAVFIFVNNVNLSLMRKHEKEWYEVGWTELLICWKYDPKCSVVETPVLFDMSNFNRDPSCICRLLSDIYDGSDPIEHQSLYVNRKTITLSATEFMCNFLTKIHV